MTTSIIRSKGRKVILYTFAAVFWIAVWYIAAFGIGNEIFLPYPHTTLLAFGTLITQKAFWVAVMNTMLTILEGCVIGCLLSVLLSIPAGLSEIGRTLASPLITVLRATPVASFIILVYVLVRRMQLPIRTVSLIIVIIMVIPILYNNLLTAYRNMDKDLAEVAKVYRFSLYKTFRVVWFPQIHPYFFSGLTTSLGFAWKAGVAAEVICNLQDTVGKHLADSKSNLEMDKLFAWTFTVILLSMIFEVVFARLLGQKKKPVSASKEDRYDPS